MKQVVQNLRSGVLELMDVPCPAASRGQLLIQSQASLISAGTERFLVEFGKASLVSKARQNPDRVKQVLDKIKADGLLPTLETVFNKLDEPLPLGYCNSGIVVGVGAGVEGYEVGDRVASNGQHAEFVKVPVNLCAKVPDDVPHEEAAFAVLGSIALQGIRLVKPELGETVVVFGLGLVGLLAVQMLVANGVKVIGIDLSDDRLSWAKQAGAQVIDPKTTSDPVAAALAATSGRGVDAVLITASAKNDSIVSQSAKMCRQRGRVVLVGVVNLELDRADFYEKEISFQVSCSYGPGRYDDDYEQKGIDYPYGFVRWTEQRNIQAVLDLMQSGKLNVKPLITHRFAHGDAVNAYELLSSKEKQMGVILQYPETAPAQERTVAIASNKTSAAGKVRIGFIGAGAFTKSVLLPAFAQTNAQLCSIASAGGVSAAHAARKFGIRNSTTDVRSILEDDAINTVVITTRHNLHASMVVDALAAGKHVFVEKPLAMNDQELQQVQDAYQATSGQQLMVGFNRRFSPHAEKMKQLLQGRTGPLCMNMMVNAGSIPSDHWVHDPESGGGRMIGEGCHWIDLMMFLAGAPITKCQAATIGDVPGVTTRTDHAAAVFTFADGSLGTLHYFANGNRAYPKEKLTVFADGKVLELDNFRLLQGFGWSNFKKFKTMRQDKGHQAECLQFVQRIADGGEPLIPFDSLWNVTHFSFQADPIAWKRVAADEQTTTLVC